MGKDKATLQMEDLLSDFYAFIENDEIKLAKIVLKRIIKKYPRHYETSHAQAHYACQKGELEKAVALFKESISREPNWAMSHYNLGITYQEVGDPDLMLIHFWLAMQCATEEEREHLSFAEQHLQEAQSKLPEGMTTPDFMEHLKQFHEARVLMRASDFAGAIKILESQSAKQPNIVEIQSTLGICYIMLRDVESAEKHLHSALKIAPDDKQSNHNLALLEKYKKGELNIFPELSFD